MNTIVTLLKREYWENRGHFAISPLVMGAFLIALFLLALFNTEHIVGTHGESLGPISLSGISISGLDYLGAFSVEFASLSLERRSEIWEMSFYGISSSFTFIMILVSFIYLLGSLYDDRKDKSILFWKSLPVSDLMTVTSKIITVIFVIPAFFVIGSTLTFLLIMIISSLVALFTNGNLWASIWEPAPFISAPIKLYGAYVIQSLWAAPFLAWLLLVSSWTKRKPILMATIPVAAVSFMEFYYYRTSYFADAVRERTMGWVIPVDITSGRHLGSNEPILDQGGIYNNVTSLMALPGFWYGLVVAAAMVAGAVYIRRYRDES